MALVEEAAEARAAIEAEERRYRESLQWCSCARPLACRTYLHSWMCRLCERAIRAPRHPQEAP